MTDNDKICAVCLSEPKNPQIQSCGHEYCRECILQLIKHRKNYLFVLCPLCRQKMYSKERKWILLPDKKTLKMKKEMEELSFYCTFIVLIISLIIFLIVEEFKN